MSDAQIEAPEFEEFEEASGKDYFADFTDTSLSDIEDDDADLPLFPFDEPREIVLKNGSIHRFNIPTLNQEKKRYGLQRSLIITSAAVINGQNPRTSKTDYSKSQIAYYQDTIREVVGYAFEEGDDTTAPIDAQRIIREDPIAGTDKVRRVKLATLIPVTDQIAAVSRMYGGKIEIVKPELKEGEKRIVVLTAQRLITAKQELGIEQRDDGSFTSAMHRILYRFREANSSDLSKWETACFDGFTLNNPKGGTKEERTYSVDACVKLFDSMIVSMEGASVGGQPVDVKNVDHLAAVLPAVKLQVISMLMYDITTNAGN